jgi:Uma2 family endonuclease
MKAEIPMSVAPSRYPQRLSRPAIPPLQNGDSLSADEFELRYDATPNLKKAELIDGIVYMLPPPVSDEFHSSPHFDLISWLGIYRAATPGVRGGDSGTLRLDLKNRPQPDAYLRILTECGGQSKIDKDGYVAGAPELIAEVAASSVSYDLHVKLNCYREHGVKEYVVWRVYDEAIDWMFLRGGNYEQLPLEMGIYKSEVFPGLWLETAAMLSGDIAAVIATLQKGLATPEHKAFLARLQKPT